MRLIIFVVLFLSCCTFVKGQRTITTNWYSENISKGVVIQNSFPKGGPYAGIPIKNFNYSFLIFFTRIVNESDTPLEITITFPADSFAIPSSPDTFMKLFLPSDTMTFAKQILYNYGLTGLESFLDFHKPTMLKRIIKPKADYLFYVGTVFYQTKSTADNRSRGGNRAELVLNGQDLFFKMPPQIDSLPVGRIVLKNE